MVGKDPARVLSFTDRRLFVRTVPDLGLLQSIPRGLFEIWSVRSRC
jgi:hypothetical protein